MAELVREVHIKASPEVIFEYLTDPAKYAEWGGTDAVLEPRPGGTFRVLMGGAHQSAGEYLEVEPDRRVLFSFGWDEPGHPIPAGSTQAYLNLKAYREFDADNRLSGWNAWVTLSLSPSAPPPASTTRPMITK